MTTRQKLIYLLALIGGFVASYYAQLWIFLVTFLLVLLFIFTDKPNERTPDNPVYANYQRNRQQRLTLTGLAFVVGGILAFILKYYIIGTK